MRRCLDLARLGLGHTGLNPCVGAVLFLNNRIVGEGLHRLEGEAHAEVNAVAAAKQGLTSLAKTQLYVSLEPCSYHGKTPACTQLLIDQGIKDIKVSMPDPNPKVNGRGIEILKANNCRVRSGLENKRGQHILRPFIVNQEKQRPYVILKWAQTSDGFIGKASHQVKISNAISDRLVHKWRSETDAILVGTNTVVVDNPMLTNRLYPGRSPIRVILDRQGRIPTNSHVLDGSHHTILFSESTRSLRNVDQIDLCFSQDIITKVLKHLFEKGISALMVEGGQQILSSFLHSQLWDECRVITSDQLLTAGIAAPQPAGYMEQEIRLLDNRVNFYIQEQLMLKSR